MEREQTTIRLPAGLKEQLQREADRRGDSFNETYSICSVGNGISIKPFFCS
jgi:hypothetical protein